VATVATELTVATRVTSQKGNEIVMQEWTAGEVVESLPVRSEVDMAEGTLIGLRRCDPNAAYHELLAEPNETASGLWPYPPLWCLSPVSPTRP
jgi:hypothetical protein